MEQKNCEVIPLENRISEGSVTLKYNSSTEPIERQLSLEFTSEVKPEEDPSPLSLKRKTSGYPKQPTFLTANLIQVSSINKRLPKCYKF